MGKGGSEEVLGQPVQAVGQQLLAEEGLDRCDAIGSVAMAGEKPNELVSHPRSLVLGERCARRRECVEVKRGPRWFSIEFDRLEGCWSTRDYVRKR